MYRIAYPRVFRDGCVIEVHFIGTWTQHYILEQRPLPYGAIDIGLAFRRKANYFRITASFEIEDGVLWRPSVFVISDQASAGVGRSGSLACARKSEEQGNITCCPHVGGAERREDMVHTGRDEVKGGKHSLSEC